MIEDGISGFICELGDTSAVADKAITLLSDRELHNKMSRQAFLRTKNIFNPKKIVDQYEKIYYETVCPV